MVSGAEEGERTIVFLDRLVQPPNSGSSEAAATPDQDSRAAEQREAKSAEVEDG